MNDFEYVNEFVDNFKWDSEIQRKGFGNMLQYFKNNGINPPSLIQINLMAAYFIQKDHESNAWWGEVLGSQVSTLQSDLMFAMEQIQGLREEVETLRKACKSVL